MSFCMLKAHCGASFLYVPLTFKFIQIQTFSEALIFTAGTRGIFLFFCIFLCLFAAKKFLVLTEFLNLLLFWLILFGMPPLRKEKFRAVHIQK